MYEILDNIIKFTTSKLQRFSLVPGPMTYLSPKTTKYFSILVLVDFTLGLWTKEGLILPFANPGRHRLIIKTIF